tara:strand:- start:360 stop:842 length:483 start_codon:yes stop_codon:yes gene_type:complete
MAKEIYNKNAREAHLMAEAYTQVNEGHAGPVHNWKKQAGLEKDFNDEQRDQDPHRHGDITDGHEREQRDQDPHRHEDAEDTDHDKGVQMALEALELFKDELRVGGHGEDINVNELADAHDQLSRALHWLLDETDVEFITGGRATQQAERDVDFKPAHGEY